MLETRSRIHEPLRTRGLLKVPLLTLHEIVLIVWLVALYTRIPLSITETISIPSFALFLLAPALLLLIRLRIFFYEAAFFVGLFVLLLLSAFLSPGLAFIDQKLLGVFQTIVSVGVGVVTLRLLDRTGKSRVARVLLLLLIVLVVGSFLEVTDILRPASNYFREIAYGDSAFVTYDESFRDAQITGFERAKFFTSEPSVLTKGFLIFVNTWLIISYSKRNLLVGLLLTMALFTFTGSLVLIVSSLITLSIAFLYEKSILSLVVLAFGALGLLGASILVSPEVFANMILRFQAVHSLGFNLPLLANYSEGVRLILPMITLVEVWKVSPLFGVGVSGEETVSNLTELSVDPILAFGNNNLMALLIYLGLLGTIAFFAIFAWYFKQIKVRNVAFLTWIIVAFSLTGGGIEEPATWGYIFMFIWAVRVYDAKNDRELFVRSWRLRTK